MKFATTGILLTLSLFTYQAMAGREVHYKITCPGSKSDTSVSSRSYVGHKGGSQYINIGCCPKGQVIASVGSRNFCCPSTYQRATCVSLFGATDCKCDGKIASTLKSAQIALLQVPSKRDQIDSFLSEWSK